MDYELTLDGTSRPTVTRVRSGMFSAEDGLFLACFLAVTIVVAGAIRFICRRYCGVKCSKCKHKQDPADTDQVPSIIIDTQHRPGDAARGAHHQQHEQNSSQLGTTTTEGTSNSTTSVHLCPPKREHGPNRRGSNNSMVAIPTMQTVYEEEESDELQEVPLRQASHSITGDEHQTEVVYTVYHFPQNHQSPELMRTLTTTLNIERSASVSSGMEACSAPAPLTDAPPSYEDLFPSNEELIPSKSDKFVNVLPR